MANVDAATADRSLAGQLSRPASLALALPLVLLLSFIDETGLSTKMARLRGRAPRGERCRAGVPHGHSKTTTFARTLRLSVSPASPAKIGQRRRAGSSG